MENDSLRNLIAMPTLDMPSALITPGHDQRVGEQPGSQLGHYRLVEQIGEGGFGSVFLAEQSEPVRRQVALKIIKLGMDTRQIIARFELERQALAMMDHPGIAKVFDAGATATGRPYFVMELVRGVPITRYCDDRQLDTRSRLKLFVNVCRAIQHAHQKGLIHRDIKPGNVLVTEVDGRPVPKVIDFGIAKATDQRLTEQTVLTGDRQLIGTPAYMSPEQMVLGGGSDLDTRTDIYSLGVLLYELLTGTPPFDPHDLANKPYDEVQRMIREVDPPRPSARLEASGDALQTIAEDRATMPAHLNRIMRRELDWVVMKCLEKDRARRYASADALATDVRRYLHDEPIAARPPSRIYKLRKFSRRNKGLIVASAAILAALLVGITGLGVGYAREQQQRKEAERQQAEAERQREYVERVVSFLQSILASMNPRSFELATLTMLHLSRELDTDAIKARPEVEASVRALMGDIYAALGMRSEALHELHSALAAHDRAAGANPIDKAQIHNQLANVYRLSHEDQLANEHHQHAMSILRQEVPSLPAQLHPSALDMAIQMALLERRPAEARWQMARGTLLARQGEFGRAEAEYTAAQKQNEADHWPLFYRAFLRLAQGNIKGYGQDRQQLLQQNRKTTVVWTAERVAKAYFISPMSESAAEADLSGFMELLEGFLDADIPAASLPWLKAAKGMGEYRLNKHEEAEESLRQAAEAMQDEQPSVRAMIEFFRAMTLQKLKNPDAARKTLQNGIEIMKQVPPGDSGDLSGRNRNWGVENWIACQIAFREASSVVLNQPINRSPLTTRPAQ